MRRQGYDYAGGGMYFITICTHNKECLFGGIRDGVMHLNVFGNIADTCWKEIPQHFSHAALHEFVIMPNHIHGVLVLDENAEKVGARHCRATTPQFGVTIPGGLAAVIGAYKSIVARRINEVRDSLGTPVWQRNYFEHIVRNEDEWGRIAQYIENNPECWESDDEYVS